MRHFIGLLLVLIVGSAAAQTPQVTLTTATRLLFPDALLLEAAVNAPASQVSGMTLSLRLGEQAPITIQYPPQPYRFANEFVVADYRLAFPLEPALPLLTEVQYRWVVSLVSGEQLAEVGSIVYDDARVAWINVASADGRVLFRADDASAAAMRTEANLTAALLARLQQETGRTSPPVRWAFYPASVTPFCETLALAGERAASPRHRYFWANAQQDTPCNPALGERVFAAAGFSVSGSAGSSGGFSVLRRELVEQAYRDLWSDNIPAWFREALIGLYLERRVDDVGIVRQALRGSRPLMLAQLQLAPSNPADAALWQAQANTMMRYLLATFGVPPVFELARRLNEFPDFASAYREILGAQINLLIPAWETWVFTDAAFLAGSYSIYAATTPTPTPTLTASPTRIPPTASSTPTPIPQVTATPRPTRTRTPPTATPTPLPPESFIIRATPTATPAPTSSGVLPVEAPPGVFVGLGVSALALIALVGYVLLRRR